MYPLTADGQYTDTVIFVCGCLRQFSEPIPVSKKFSVQNFKEVNLPSKKLALYRVARRDDSERHFNIPLYISRQPFLNKIVFPSCRVLLVP
jgi:hypothetical protein